MDRKIDVYRVLHNLITEYEKVQGKIRFSFIKRKEEFIFVNGSSLFLEVFHLTRKEFINASLQILCPYGNRYQQMYDLYEQAWNGKKVIYYISSPNNQLFVILLYPILVNEITKEVEGKCAVLSDYQVPVQQNSSYFFDCTDFVNPQ
ncbi:hypothetical protein FC694_03110 [Bacillus wiedmannii]|uniref:Uncharacterized protein n=1 Tax=Bacillus wiedmannii TaxID=1890302 RepID=A0A4U2N3J0_9BACI|nr:hypothetical protein [Bacillus wiedmannii]TKH18972.1 hypothetical protein FC694_03110 [Bacillus wiedmannii]